MAAQAHTLLDDGAPLGKILLQPERTELRYKT